MQKSGQTYRCAAGESWDTIALAVYGDERYAAELIAANPRISGRTVMQGGEALSLPVVSARETAAGYTQSAPWREE